MYAKRGKVLAAKLDRLYYDPRFKDEPWDSEFSTVYSFWMGMNASDLPRFDKRLDLNGLMDGSNPARTKTTRPRKSAACCCCRRLMQQTMNETATQILAQIVVEHDCHCGACARMGEVRWIFARQLYTSGTRLDPPDGDAEFCWIPLVAGAL